jgi:hypothetical protein
MSECAPNCGGSWRESDDLISPVGCGIAMSMSLPPKKRKSPAEARVSDRVGSNHWRRQSWRGQHSGVSTRRRITFGIRVRMTPNRKKPPLALARQCRDAVSASSPVAAKRSILRWLALHGTEPKKRLGWPREKAGTIGAAPNVLKNEISRRCDTVRPVRSQCGPVRAEPGAKLTSLLESATLPLAICTLTRWQRHSVLPVQRSCRAIPESAPLTVGSRVRSSCSAQQQWS